MWHSLIQEFRLPGEKNINGVVGISEEDLILLIKFTYGIMVHGGVRETESMLNDHRDRLSRSLGVLVAAL